MRRLVADTKELLSTTADTADKSAKAARDKVEESLKQVQTQVDRGVSKAEDILQEQVQRADHVIRTNPYKAVGIGFGAGLLVGFLFGKK